MLFVVSEIRMALGYMNRMAFYQFEAKPCW